MLQIFLFGYFKSRSGVTHVTMTPLGDERECRGLAVDLDGGVDVQGREESNAGRG
jgi:hypothetical protein